MTSGWIESICVIDGDLPLLRYHQDRMDRTLRDHFQEIDATDLHAVRIPEQARHGWYKCRIHYTNSIQTVEWIPYSVRPIERLIVKEEDQLDYSYKYADRTAFQLLKNDLGDREDVLITQDGLLTDSSYSNILCFDGKDYWTPDTPLLEGTRRQFLLDQEKIKAATLSIESLPQFKFIQLINAMMGLEKGPRIPIDNIIRL